MAMLSTINPVYYVVQRQYKDNLCIQNKLFSERLVKARNLYRKDLLAHFGCVNAIEFSENGEYLVSGGDDKRVLLWKLATAIFDRGIPIVMRTPHGSNIFCLTLDSRNEKIFSGGNDDQVLIHEISTRNLLMAIPHEKPVYGISIHPQNDNIIATAGEDGRILLFDVREAPIQEAQTLAQQNSGFHSVMFNPTNPRFLVTANSDEGIGLWDCRKPKIELVHYDSQGGKTSGISACFDSSGKRVLALRRRLPPVLYATESEHALCQFYHPQYYNSCTMKTCCFAGAKDEYVLSGSDDFNLYMWKVPNDNSEWGTSHIVLRGHRSIVNQVRYNSHNHLMASSGVEKMVKLWSAIPIGNWKGSILKEHADPTRAIYTHEDYVSLVGTTERINHDYSDQSMNEDAKMMAFFDSLIQREIEGWDSQSEESLSSNSASEGEQDWSKVISKIFRNGRHSSEEPRKFKTNRITQLISKKKNRLAKLAHNKSSSYIRRRNHQEKAHKKKLIKSKALFRKHNGFHKRSYRKSSSDREHRKKKTVKEPRASKYFTRQSLRNAGEQSGSLDVPSTSTGITSSKSSLFRLIEQDSDEEPRNSNENADVDDNAGVVDESNFINILPTPINGTKDILINVLEMANRNVPQNQRSHPVTRSQHQLHQQQEESASHSSNSSRQAIDDGFSDTSDSDLEYGHTPKRRCISAASDSGCCPSSSASSCSTKNGNLITKVPYPKNHQACSSSRAGGDSSEEEGGRRYEKIRRRARNSKATAVRRKIAHDSDSN